MDTFTRILRYTLIIMLVVLLGGLAGWYAYLQTQKNPLAPSTSDTAGDQGSNASNRGGTTGNDAAPPPSAGDSSVPTKKIERLWKVALGPVAGFGFGPPANASSSAPLFFAERANGYIFQADTGAQQVSRITNTLMPKVYEAYFGASGTFALLRSLDENGSITTFAATFLTDDATTTPQALQGSYWSAGILDVALDSKGGVFTLTADGASGGSIGSTRLADGSKETRMFSSFIRSWHPLYGKDGLVLLTKPSDDIPGYAYRVGTNGALLPLTAPLPGLSVLPHPTQSALLYSGSGGGQLRLFVQVGTADAIGIELQTVADKCVWAPSVGKSPSGQAGAPLIVYCAVPSRIASATFLNDWYRGALHTEDSWWKIDAATGEAELVFTPPSPLDVQKPVIDESGAFIAFVNGNDQSLWVLRLVQ